MSTEYYVTGRVIHLGLKDDSELSPAALKVKGTPRDWSNSFYSDDSNDRENRIMAVQAYARHARTWGHKVLVSTIVIRTAESRPLPVNNCLYVSHVGHAGNQSGKTCTANACY